ncbi:MAG: hypothetical protein ACETVY_00655 [Candidatus Bathyarchaeia archaeon]
MVKEGNTIKNYRFDDVDPETITIGVTVYFPEIDDDGGIDLGNWCLSKEEAELKERWFGFIRKLQSEYSRIEKRKKEFWTITCEELGLEKYAFKKEEGKRTPQT